MRCCSKDQRPSRAPLSGTALPLLSFECPGFRFAQILLSSLTVSMRLTGFENIPVSRDCADRQSAGHRSPQQKVVHDALHGSGFALRLRGRAQETHTPGMLVVGAPRRWWFRAGAAVNRSRARSRAAERSEPAAGIRQSAIGSASPGTALANGSATGAQYRFQFPKHKRLRESC